MHGLTLIRFAAFPYGLRLQLMLLCWSPIIFCPNEAVKL